MTKTVPLHELQPGDVVTIPRLTVISVNKDPMCQFAYMDCGSGFYLSALRCAGATATREVEPEYNLTWDQADIAVGWDKSYIDAAGSRASELVQYDLTAREAQRLLNYLAQDPKTQTDIAVWVETMKEKNNAERHH